MQVKITLWLHLTHFTMAKVTTSSDSSCGVVMKQGEHFSTAGLSANLGKQSDSFSEIWELFYFLESRIPLLHIYTQRVPKIPQRHLLSYVHSSCPWTEDTRPSESQQNWCTYELRETEAACTWLHGFAPQDMTGLREEGDRSSKY